MMSNFSVLLEIPNIQKNVGLSNTVEPLINGHNGYRHFVFYREIILSSYVKIFDCDLKVCPL